jgi:hypothetical protein
VKSSRTASTRSGPSFLPTVHGLRAVSCPAASAHKKGYKNLARQPRAQNIHHRGRGHPAWFSKSPRSTSSPAWRSSSNPVSPASLRGLSAACVVLWKMRGLSVGYRGLPWSQPHNFRLLSLPGAMFGRRSLPRDFQSPYSMVPDWQRLVRACRRPVRMSRFSNCVGAPRGSLAIRVTGSGI